ncbi:MAG: phosphoglycerate mutase [Rhodospirillaceae bacterium]|nr:phosphoglycerate mutase [Rhodospirillaceae bacterium]|tara:strand:+ start:1164 stop:1784 length:621 start_codon:yes stop_codon:yes gene_type:complete
MLETRWYFVRHAPVDNQEGRIYGASNPSANVSDFRSFEILAQRLPVSAISVTSHLRRTHQTLQALENSGLKIKKQIVDKRLGEQDFGDWVGKTHDEAQKLFGDSYDQFWLAPGSGKPPNGESFLEVLERVQTCVRELTLKFRGKDIICVAHGGSIRAALALALGLNGDQAMVFSIDNLSTTVIDYIHPENGFHGGWRVRGTNLPSV